jgi:hypothetical protein
MEENVALIDSIMAEHIWDNIFPYAHNLLTRENFLKAATKFP